MAGTRQHCHRTSHDCYRYCRYQPSCGKFAVWEKHAGGWAVGLLDERASTGGVDHDPSSWRGSRSGYSAPLVRSG